ncbi:SRPBCC family protein [Pseudoxanthomonas sacheonensis]|uniref:SRPBCC family protein n=1 Tax=Pseudoxanthomonas sacheonensis TaxID=443615 RepID=UPI0013D44264|nr:SRPBCC family protein [Pseudoxanthomonas sacheonensis]KAF1711813.1 ATPase [Pseudoxanthomonas sacheonensis]
MSPAPPIEVRVTRYFETAPERVFDAWLVPRTLGQWMFGPRVREENVVRLDVDPRVGGSFSLKVERNGEIIDHVGRYLEIERPHRLVFTWAVKGQSDDEPSQVRIDIAASSSGCVLTLVHSMDAKWAEYAQRTQDGWNTMLDALAGLF